MTIRTIAQLCPQLNSGGIERGTVDVAIAAKKAGHRSIVISGGGRLCDELKNASVEHITLPVYQKSPLAIYRNSRALRTVIQEMEIDLLHARSRAPLWAAHYALNNQNTTLVTSCHSPHSLGPCNIKKHYNRPITYGKRVIATSDFIATYLKNTYQTSPDKIDVIYRGIDCDYFNPDHFNVNTLKTSLNIPQNKTIVLLPGRITRWKGQDIVLDALAKLGGKNNFYVLIVGRIDSADYFTELSHFIKQHALENCVRFIEECFDIASFYAVSDITLSTSRKPEAFGRVAVEGRAMKSLVIATNIGAATETVLPNKTGLLIPPDNAKALADALTYIQSLSSSEQQTMRINARERALSHFNKPLMLEKTLATYDKAMASITRDADRSAKSSS